jgi:S1-C subfamily serine protease
VEKLYIEVLALKPSTILETEPVPVARTPVQEDDTYKVASGSGFYVTDTGHIITNYHVIEGCKDMKVHSKGNVLETKQIAQDRRNDLALLKISGTPKHSFALSTESPFPLQDVVVAGYPFGNRVSSTLKFTEGIISSIAGLGDDYSQIQIDAAIQPGNSGGPILDEYGNVVAVAVAKLSLKKILKDYGVVPENTNFGVKASAVRNLMEGNGVSFKSPNTEVISKRELSQVATDGTVYLTCWMTTAQIEQMRARKVLFEDLE